MLLLKHLSGISKARVLNHKFLATKTTFKELKEIPDFPKDEENILKFWDEIDAFK